MDRLPLTPLLLLCLGLTAGLCVPGRAAAALERQFVFFPDRTIYATPALLGLPFEEVRFAAADSVRLHGWYIPGTSGQPLVLFCHGNAGNISHRLETLRHLQALGLSVFLFDYRGYGLSEGTPSEEGTYADARGALAWLRQRGWEPARMIYAGESLGAAVALQLALEAPPAALVMEAPFPSIAAMGRHHYPLLYPLLGWVLSARYDSAAKIGALRVPLLVIQGSADDIVPPAMARKLFNAAGEPKTLRLIPGAGHNDLTVADEATYRAAWRDLISASFPSATNR